MKTIHTKHAPAAIGPYSQAKKVGPFLFLSGQIGIDPKAGKITAPSLEEQATQIFLNITAILEKAGYTMDDVVKTTCFLTDLSGFGAFNGIYEKYFTSKPARSCVEVSALPAGALCEVEVVAYKK
ncbi:MAG TPA: regulator [Dialister sp.]|nr:regulator [Dialister sp.]